MVNKKDFNAIVFTGVETIGNKGYVKYRKQTSVERLLKYFNNKYPLWQYCWLYDRKTDEKEMIRPG